MTRIRLVEESLIQHISDGTVRCPCHLYTGEEAVAVGVCAALKNSDHVYSNHRSHGHYLAKGGDLKALIAEIYGKDAGCSRGRGGSMHVYAPEKGMMGSAPIVAGTISLALGSALAFRIRKEKRVAVSFFGDGATGEGVLCESLNFAALKKLPIIFVCENNFYSTHLHIHDIRVSDKIYKIAEPFGMKTHRVDGNDVMAVHKVAALAVDACRKGKGPVFIEAVTYRMHGHVGPDDNIQGTHTDIRPKREIEKWKKKDPINCFEAYLLKKKIMTQQEMIAFKVKIQQEITEAHSFAKLSAYPNKNDLGKYVFSN